MNLILTSLAISATVLGSGMALPQARRVARTRRVEGVSATWVGVSVILNLWWLVYAVAERVYVLVPVSVISTLLYTTIGIFVVRATGRRSVLAIAAGALGLGMVPLPFLLAGGWALAGVAIGGCYGLQLAPAVVATFRTRVLVGVSSLTWLLAWLESMLWLGYGVGIRDAALIAGGAVGAVMSAAILVRLAVTGHRPFAAFAQLAGRTLPGRRRVMVEVGQGRVS